MRAFLLLPLLMLAACGQSSDDPDYGGVTADQARELNQAAAMLDANSVSADAVLNEDKAR
jgi:hypothetical protein